MDCCAYSEPEESILTSTIPAFSMNTILNYLWGRRNPQPTVRDPVVTLREQVQLIDSKLAYLQTKLDEQAATVAAAQALGLNNNRGTDPPPHFTLSLSNTLVQLWCRVDARAALGQKCVLEDELARVQRMRAELCARIAELERGDSEEARAAQEAASSPFYDEADGEDVVSDYGWGLPLEDGPDLEVRAVLPVAKQYGTTRLLTCPLPRAGCSIPRRFHVHGRRQVRAGPRVRARPLATLTRIARPGWRGSRGILDSAGRSGGLSGDSR